MALEVEEEHLYEALGVPEEVEKEEHVFEAVVEGLMRVAKGHSLEVEGVVEEVHCPSVYAVRDELKAEVEVGVLMKVFSVVKAAEAHSLEEQHENDSAGDFVAYLVEEGEADHLDLV